MKIRLFSIKAEGIKFSAFITYGLNTKRTNPCVSCKAFSEEIFASSKSLRILYPEIPWPDTEFDGIHILYAQKKWPDALDSCLGIGVYSDRVISALENAGISCFTKIPLFLFDVPKTKVPDREYFAVFPNTTVNEDVVESELTKPFICPTCGRFDSHAFIQKYHETGIMYESRLRESDYHGEDLVFVRYFGDRSSTYCSEKVIDLCYQEKWTNFKFTDYSNPLIPNGVTVRHDRPNWRELLEQDIAQKRAELRGEIPPPIHVSVPETPPQEEAPKPVSNHPFDHLSAFDGFAWQGTTHLPCAFGVCDFIVYEDEEASDDESDEPLPTLGQRHLFDFFVASQEKILPPLQEALLRALQTCNVSVSEVESFSDLSQFLESGDLEIHKASSKGRGDLSILFSIKDHSKTISVKWSCTPSRDSIRLKSIHFVD